MTVSATTADGRARILADGNQMPMLGLGIWQVPNGPTSVNAVRWALDLGYRHIDTAQAYGNEESVGKALRDSGLPRDQVFITTKFYPGGNDPAAEARRSLRRLGVDQVDLYLVHWPQGGPVWAWPGMEQARELGYARSVGVSNFSASELAEVMAAGTIPPAVNQVQFSPQQYRRALQEQELLAAEAAGVDALVAVYHSDHRELCAHERDWPFRILNMYEIVGASMGLHHDDQFKKFKIMQDADAILADCQDLISQHGLDVETTRLAIKAMLDEQPAPLRGA